MESAPPVSLNRTAFCLRCGYSIQRLTTCRCPECGLAFEPGDRLTYRIRKRLVWRLRPPWLCIAGAVALLGMSWMAADPFDGFMEMFVWSAWAALLLVWVGALCYQTVSWIRARTTKGSKIFRPHRIVRLGWAAPPVLFLAAFWLVQTNFPFRVEFFLSRGEFARAEKAASAWSHAGAIRQPVGYFEIERIDVTQEGYYFQVANRHRYFFHRAGGGPPRLPREIDLGGGWAAGDYPDS